MKNLVSFIFLLALLVSGCSQEEMLKGVTSASSGRIFTTSFEQKDSRTFVKDGYLSRWMANDRISLFDSNTLNLEYKFDGETGDYEGTFSMVNISGGTGSSLTSNYAVYPYSKDIQIAADGQITTTLPSEQHYAENSFGVGDNTMVAVTQNTDDTFLTFKNVCGGLKFQLYGDDVTVKSVILLGNNGELISGNATIKAAYDENPIVTMADDATTTITLDCGENGVKIGATADEATAFWMVIPPVMFENGVTVVVKDVNGKVFTQTIDKQLSIERNVVKLMEFKVVSKSPQLAFSADEGELEGWSAGLFGGDGTYVMGKPHGENGYLMMLGNILEGNNGLVYMDASRQIREMFIDNTIITFGENTNESIDVSIIEKGGVEKLEHIVLSSNILKSRSSDDYTHMDGVKDWADNLHGMYESLKEINKASDFSKKGFIFFFINKLESIRSITKTAGGVDITNSKELSQWLDVGSGIVDIAELVIFRSVGGVVYIAADLIIKFNEIKNERIEQIYGDCIASIADIEYENNTLNIDLRVSGYESTISEFECGVIVKKSNLPFAPPVGTFPSNVETKMVSGDGNYSFSVGGIEEGESYWCYPFLIEINRISYWIGFIGEMAGPFVRYGKAVKYEPEDNELREALIKLYESTNGDNWTRKTNWCSDKPVEQWSGVSKLGDKQYSINLNGNNLTGKIEQTFPNNLNIQLYLFNNQLTSLEITDSNSLTELNCNTNQLTSLNVSGCTSLTKLYCNYNQLTSLDVSDCAELTFIQCLENQFETLDFSGCTSLTNLPFMGSLYTSLDVSGCASLTSLDLSTVDSEQLTFLDVSDCTSLTRLDCSDNQLISLNVSGCVALTELYCYYNQLTSLDVSGCASLTRLNCCYNQLTSLNVSGCTSLTHLSCNNNKITSVIPDWFSQLSTFTHDIRFRYWKESVPDGDGGYVTIDRYEDRGIGWWYPGEPGKYEHSPD